MGAQAGAALFLRHGFRASTYLSIAFILCALLLFLMRGPNSPRHSWVGWSGGASLRKPAHEQRVLVAPNEKAGAFRFALYISWRPERDITGSAPSSTPSSTPCTGSSRRVA
jgi:hypothetical protein